tara:strand:+ start:370 stop:498 length:129 start_codon:yes stop_codon:yes gene_type:complete
MSEESESLDKFEISGSFLFFVESGISLFYEAKKDLKKLIEVL